MSDSFVNRRKTMKEEYEIIEHSQIEDLNIFLVEMTYRCPHMHREFEICMVLSGTVIIYTNGERHNFERGSLILFNPRQTHEIHTLTENSLILSVQVASGFYKRIYSEISRLQFDGIAVAGDNGRLLQKMQLLILKLASAYLKKETGYEFFCMAYLSEFFGELLQNQPWHLISEKEKSERYTKGKRMSRIMDYVENHYTEKLLLSDISELEGLSVYYLSHFFKEMLGLSFQEYIALRRFERARKMVEQTNRSLTEICMECGFSDYRYLNKIYKKQLGYTPIEYRSSHEISLVNEKKEEDVTNTQVFCSIEDSLELLKIAEERYKI